MTSKKPKPAAVSPFRQLWTLAPGTVFLNHGSFGACPREILRLQSDLRERLEAEPVQFLWRHYEDRLGPSRETVARFVGADPADLVFVTNATSAVNAILRSIRLKPGDEILTTDQDYNACRNVLARAAEETGAKLVTATIPLPVSSVGQVVEAVLRSVTSRTRFAMLDHVTSGSAMILPVAELLGELQLKGVEVLIDGAHAPGMLDLDVGRLQPAYYTGNLHKWVCAPKGAAFLWARKDKQAGLQPAVVSHGNNTPRPGFSRFQDRFDWAGTFDPTGWLCAGAAIEYLGALLLGGWAELRRRNHELAVAGRRLLAERLGVEMLCPETSLGSMATVPLPQRFQGRPPSGKIDVEQLALYDRHQIEVPFSRLAGTGLRCLRISCQAYNCLDEYRYLADALDAI